MADTLELAASLLRSAYGHPASDPFVVRRALTNHDNDTSTQTYVVRHPHGANACLATKSVALLFCAALGRDVSLLYGTAADAWALARTGAPATSTAPAVAAMPPYLKIDARLVDPAHHPPPAHVLAVGLRPGSARVVRLGHRGGTGLAEELGRLAEAGDVAWVEPWHPVTTQNRYARGTCQSGSYQYQPFEAAHVNLTGQGQVVGVSDTGLDARSCFFVDASVDVPYATAAATTTSGTSGTASAAAATTSSHRKLTVYIPHKDGVDDENGHGTHVAATIAGKCAGGTASTKLAAYDGMAYNAKIAFFDIGVTGSAELSPPLYLDSELFLPMYRAGARIFSNSWGSPSDASYSFYSNSVDRFMHAYPEALVLFAAGNDGPDAYTVDSPSTNKNGVSVGASLTDSPYTVPAAADGARRRHLRSAGRTGNGAGTSAGTSATVPSSSGGGGVNSLAFFSSAGPTLDGRRKPDVAGAGWWVTSARSADAGDVQMYTAAGDNAHCSVTRQRGTSMATAVVAGHVALVREYFVDGFYPSGARHAADGFAPSGALMKAVLVASAVPLDTVYASAYDTGGVPSVTPLGDAPTNSAGYGRVQLDRVLSFASSTTTKSSSSSSSSSSSTTAAGATALFVVGAADATSPLYAAITRSGQSVEYPFRTSRDTHATMSFTLAYTDYPGTYGARRCLVNALWLTVVDDTGAVVGGGGDGSTVVDNVHHVVLTPSHHGALYTVRVTGLLATSTAQPFALVVVGAAAAGTGTGSGTSVAKRLVDTAAGLMGGFQTPTTTKDVAIAVVAAMLVLSCLLCAATWCCRLCRWTV